MTVLRFLGELWMCHKSQGACSVLHTDYHHPSHGKILPQVATVMFCLETASVNPYHYRQTVVDRCGRRSNTQIKTVFTHHVGSTTRTSRLWRPGAELIRLQHSCPWFCRLRFFPTEVSYRRCCIRNRFINSK